MARTKATKKSGGTAAKPKKAAGAKKPRKRTAKAGDGGEDSEDEDLPKDEAGRSKIKKQYEDLLGIRIDKLKGRVLNRERINKTIEGIYFICASCKTICHNLDEGLVEDPENENNLCEKCGKSKEPRGKKGGKKKVAAA